MIYLLCSSYVLPSDWPILWYPITYACVWRCIQVV